MQVLLLCGGHQKVIDVVGDGTELLLAAIEQLTRRKWSFAIRDRGPLISVGCSDGTRGAVDKSSGQLGLADWRWTGTKDLRFRTGTLRTCVFEHALSADQHSTP
jgi:hypothetical protein